MFGDVQFEMCKPCTLAEQAAHEERQAARLRAAQAAARAQVSLTSYELQSAVDFVFGLKV